MSLDELVFALEGSFIRERQGHTTTAFSLPDATSLQKRKKALFSLFLLDRKITPCNITLVKSHICTYSLLPPLVLPPISTLDEFIPPSPDDSLHYLASHAIRVL